MQTLPGTTGSRQACRACGFESRPSDHSPAPVGVLLLPRGSKSGPPHARGEEVRQNHSPLSKGVCSGPATRAG